MASARKKPSGSKEAALVQAVNRGYMLKWLKRHAMRVPAGPLTPQQERDIAECFQLLDEDGSGALDVSELVSAFKLLGFKADPASVRAMMCQYQGEARESLQQHEFRALMAHRLANGSAGEGEEAEGADAGSYGMPFVEIARATRRKQNLAMVMAGGAQRQAFIDREAAAQQGQQTARSNKSQRTFRGGQTERRRAAGRTAAGLDATSRHGDTQEDAEDREAEAEATAEDLVAACMERPWVEQQGKATGWRNARRG